jgi:phenylacetate-CoA ligase
MPQINFRKWLYFTLLQLRGHPAGALYNRYLKELQKGISADTTKSQLIRLLSHCKESVPYYSRIISEMGDGFLADPEEYLKSFPVLTKDIIRSNFEELKSSDLANRHWMYNTSGGSTGEPVKFIQDYQFYAESGAIKMLYSKLAGREIGESEVYLWGSERDILLGSQGWKVKLLNKLTNTTFLNAFRMGNDQMREYIAVLNTNRPKLITAYTEAIFELAKFAESEELEVRPQKAIIVSAGVLFPFMREKIEHVFQCRIYNRYGSREVGDIACERPDAEGLWVAPWGAYLEVADEQGNRLPDGTEGEILVTSLSNFAMPLIRYRIGDRGMLKTQKTGTGSVTAQFLDDIIGRVNDTFVTSTGAKLHSGYFMVLLFHKTWIRNFQIIQKSPTLIVYRIVKSEVECPQSDLNEIIHNVKMVMGEECNVLFEFVEEIPTSDSGKYRYTISEI